METRTPLDGTHDLVTFTINNEWNHSQFTSQPFRVASGTGWIDPNSATDDGGNAPVGTLTINDPLGRVRAVQDPAAGSAAEPGIACANMSGAYTSCSGHGLGSPYGDSHLYDYTITHDPNNHMAVSFTDALGRDRYAQAYSVAGSVGSNITTKKETQYNVLDKPTGVIVTDMAPQSGQNITSVTTTSGYDDLGRMTSLNDPDRGTHTYSYDADGRQTSDVSGSRTIGTSYDLFGRVLCIQDAAPTTNGSGACSSGSHPLVQNSYGTSYLQLAGTTDYATGRLTQSVASTYYADGTSATTTQQFEHDQRGRIIATNLRIGVPSSWNVTTALPTYLETQAYNDNDQPTTTQTTVGGQPGYTYSQAYDGTTGMLTGLSNNAVGVANLATQSYDPHGMVSDINFLASSGSNQVTLANDHYTFDGDLRPASSSATWQSGSGATGTIFSSTRGYDPAGNVISSSTTHAAVPGQSSSGGSETQNFCYDEQNRLVWAGNSGTQPGAGNGVCGSGTLSNSLSGAGYSNSFAYTHLGHLWQAPLNGTGAVQQYLYCDSTHPHRLTGLYPVGTTCANLSGAVYSTGYDAWGNLTARTFNGKTATLGYDVLDHLTKWDWDAANADRDQEWYAYDSAGQRTLDRHVSNGVTTLTVYAFGLEEHLYSGTGTNTSNSYYYTLGGRLLGKTDGTTTQFFLTDALGSVLSAFSAVAGTAAVLANQVYGPYGNQRYSKGSMGTTKGFTGQYNDATGLDYYNARYYDPVVGLFVSADTVQGNLLGVSPYMYVGGNPETMNDPTGRFWMELAFGIAMAGVAVAAAGIIIATAPVSIPTVLAVAAPLMISGGFGVAAGYIGVGIGYDIANGHGPTTQEEEDNLAKQEIVGEVLSGAGSLAMTLGGMVGTSFFGGSSEDVFSGPAAAGGEFGSGAVGVFVTGGGSAGASWAVNRYPADGSSQQNNKKDGPTENVPHDNGNSGNSQPSSGSSDPGRQSTPSVPSGRTGQSSSPAPTTPTSRTYTVSPGDTLWGIAASFYGSGYQWGRIYGANRGVIGGNPDLIYPGERLTIPR